MIPLLRFLIAVGACARHPISTANNDASGRTMPVKNISACPGSPELSNDRTARISFRKELRLAEFIKLPSIAGTFLTFPTLQAFGKSAAGCLVEQRATRSEVAIG